MSSAWRKNDVCYRRVANSGTLGSTGPYTSGGAIVVRGAFRSKVRWPRPGFRPGLPVGDPAAPPWFRPARPKFVLKVRCGGAGKPRLVKPDFQPKPRSVIGIWSRNYCMY